MSKFNTFLLLCILFIGAKEANACTISSNDNNLTQADLISCLDACISNCTIDIQANVSFNETIDLTAYENLTFLISGNGTVTLNGDNDLLLSGSSSIVITSSATNALKSNQPGSDLVIEIGAMKYTSDDLSAIIAAGGADGTGLLPIELAYFRANVEQSSIMLTWMTNVEINNDYMAVEYSLDGFEFREIGRVQGAGNTSAEQYYHFEHSNVKNTTNYYRLKQVDFDGREEVFPVIIARMDLKEASLNVFPNPATDLINIDIRGVEADVVLLRITDSRGRMVQQTQQVVADILEGMDISHLAAGIYFLSIQTLEGTFTQKIQKR